MSGWVSESVTLTCSDELSAITCSSVSVGERERERERDRERERERQGERERERQGERERERQGERERERAEYGLTSCDGLPPTVAVTRGSEVTSEGPSSGS